MKNPVLTKGDFVRRFMADEFGNRGPNWVTPQELKDSGYRGLVHLRNKQAGGPTHYNLGIDDVDLYWTAYGCSPSSHYLAGMAPTERTTLQGEVALLPELTLTYTTVAKPMREALALSTRTSTGLVAQSLLRTHMNAASYDWLQELIDNYPDHVIEFSCYSTDWGTFPGYNTVFWEVRRY